MLRDFLTARYLADLPSDELVRKMEDHHFLKSPRAATIVSLCCGLYRNNYSTQTLNVIFKQMAAQNSRRSKKVVFKPKTDPDLMDQNFMRSGSVMSYCHSLMALTEVEGRDDAIELLAPSFPRLLQMCGDGIVNPRMAAGLCYMLNDNRVKLQNFEVNLVHLHSRQRDLFISVAESLSNSYHLKNITAAWSSISLMSEFLKTCLARSPKLQTLRVEDHDRKCTKVIEATTMADIQSFCSSLASVQKFSFVSCRSSSITCHVINSLPGELQILDLTRSSINMMAADSLGQFMENSKATKELRLTDTDLEGSDFAALFQGLKRCETLKNLHLSGITLSRIGFGHLIEFLKLSSNIVNLDLSRGRLTLEMCSALAALLNEEGSLKRIDLTDTIIPPKGRELLEASARDVLLEGVEEEGY